MSLARTGCSVIVAEIGVRIQTLTQAIQQTAAIIQSPTSAAEVGVLEQRFQHQALGLSVWLMALQVQKALDSAE